MKEEIRKRSIDVASQAMLVEADKAGLEMAWDRYQAQLPLFGFGELGTCCRNCMQGPCRIDPFGEGPQLGACGATADTIVARNLDRAIAGGTAAHSGHAKHLAHTLLKAARGEAPDYGVKDEAKLMAVAARLGLDTERQSMNDVAEAAGAACAACSRRLFPRDSKFASQSAAVFAKAGQLCYAKSSSDAKRYLK